MGGANSTLSLDLYNPVNPKVSEVLSNSQDLVTVIQYTGCVDYIPQILNYFARPADPTPIPISSLGKEIEGVAPIIKGYLDKKGVSSSGQDKIVDALSKYFISIGNVVVDSSGMIDLTNYNKVLTDSVKSICTDASNNSMLGSHIVQGKSSFGNSSNSSSGILTVIVIIILLVGLWIYYKKYYKKGTNLAPTLSAFGRMAKSVRKM